MAMVNNVNIIKLSEFLPSVKHEICNKHQDVIAGVLNSTNYSWLAFETTLVLVNNFNASIRTSWCFQNEYDNSDITCVAELPFEKCQIPLLIVGISSTSSSKLFIFNPNTCKVIRTLQLNIQVRCLSVIEDGHVNNVHPFTDILAEMQGVIAVGAADGSLILIDLNREFLVRAIEGDLKCESIEDNPSELNLVSLYDSAQSMQFQLNQAQLNGDSLGLTLIDGSIIKDDGITALEYSKETACLYIGFSSGSWHIWNLISLKKLYSSPTSEFPVFGFSQLEPCDDPRHTVYVWVTCQAPSHSLPLASLYSISYGKKDFVEQYGTFYEEFQQCNLVFEMSPGEEKEGVTSARVVSVGTISKTINKPTNYCIGLPDCEGTQLRLTATVYSLERQGDIETRMLLFDLNRWYAEQMPSSIEETTVQMTRAGVIRSLIDISSISHSQLIALKILENTLQVFTNSYADTACTQISFEMIGINSEGIFHGEKLGAQKEWLRNSEIVGSRALINPQQLYRACLNSGLSLFYNDFFDYDNPSLDEMRSYILSAWLEYKMFSCIMDCADCWSNGSHSVSGCTLAYLLDWLWSQFVYCKTVAHHLCRILFDGSGLEFDLAERKKLKHCSVLIHSVYTLYSQIVNKHSKFILNDSSKNKLQAMSLLISYIDQVIFFTYLGVLPEVNHLGMPRSSIPYDSVRLQKYASQRNVYLIRALEECKRTRPHISPPIHGLYMVDSFNFTEDGIKVIDYPPFSIQMLLRIWLKVETSIKEKFSMSYYFLLDLMNTCDEDKYHMFLEKVANYPSTLAMTNSQVYLVKALWNLDHSFYEDGMKLLMSSEVLTSDITDSQNRSILRLLFIESRYDLALQYLRSKQPALHLPDDIKLEMSLLIANKLIDEAHLFQRRNSRFRQSLLMQFFTEQSITQLKDIIKLNLDSTEEAMFIKFLKDQKEPRFDDLHIMFLISRAKFEEVVELHGKLKSRNAFRGICARDRFVEGISSSLSNVNNLINIESLFETYSIPKKLTKPLSAYVKTSMSEGFPAPQLCDNAVAAWALKCARRSSANQDFNKLQSNIPSNGFPEIHTRKVVGIRGRPAPPTPHSKRIRSLDHELCTNMFVRNDSKKQKLENNKEALDKEEVERFLSTPVIERRRPPPAQLDQSSLTPHSPPHSILKKINDHKTKTPVKGNNKIDGSDQTDLTPRKSLRFTLPREERPSDKLKCSMRLSARRSLRKATPNNGDLAETSASSSSSLSTTDLSENSMKDIVSSTPLQTSIKRSNPVDWKSIMDEAKPRTLFTIGAGTPAKSKSTSSNTSNKTYLDGFLRKMAMEPSSKSKEENHVNIGVGEDHVVDEAKSFTSQLLLNNSEVKDLVAAETETRLDTNNRTDVDKDNDNIDHTSNTQTPKDQEIAYRTRSAAALRSSKLVEDLLATPRTRLRKRLEQRVGNEESVENKAGGINNENRGSSYEIHSTPTRRMQRIEMHMEKKIRLEIKEVDEDGVDDESGEELEEGSSTEIAREHHIEIVQQEVMPDHQPVPQVSQYESTAAEVKREDAERAVLESEEKGAAEKEENVQMEISEECIEDENIEDEKGKTGGVDVEVDTPDVEVKKQVVEKEKTERSSEFGSVKNATIENVDVRADLKATMKMPLTAAIPRDYHALTPVPPDPVMLGAVAPAQPLQDYFTGDDDDDDDDLYGDLEEAEEAEMPPKMDFDQPEEGGFGGLYEELQEEEAGGGASKPPKSDSDSSVICLDSDSESEAKNFNKNNSTKLDYEEDSYDGENSDSAPVRSRSFFHDKFRKYSEYEDCEDELVEEEEEDEEEDEDEESDGESACEDEGVAEEEVEEGEEEDEEVDEEEAREDEGIEEESPEVEESHSEGTPDVAVTAVDERNKEEAEPEIIDEKVVSEEQKEQSVEANTEKIETAESNDSQSMPTLSKELDSNTVTSEHSDEQAPHLVKEIELETKLQDTNDPQASFNLRIMEVSSIDKSQEIEELWLTPVIEEVEEENTTKNDEGIVVKENLSSDLRKTQEREDKSSTSKRIEDVDMAPVVNPPSQECDEPMVVDNKESEDKTEVAEEGEHLPNYGTDIKLQVEQEMFADNIVEAVSTKEAKLEEEKVKTEVSNKEDDTEIAKKHGSEELENMVDKVDLSDTELDNNHAPIITGQNETQASLISSKEIQNKESKMPEEIDKNNEKARVEEKQISVGETEISKTEDSATKVKIGVEDQNVKVVAESSAEVNFVDAESEETRISEATSEKELPVQQSDNIPVDLFTLGKGEMFFGSPEDVKTSATELATFQVGRTSLSGQDESKTVASQSEVGERSTASTSEYSVAEMDMAMIVDDSLGTPSQIPVTPVKPQIQAEKLETFKKLVDKTLITDKASIIESSLNYLELCVPEGSLPKRKISPKRNSRASSEQPSTAYSHVNDDQQTSRRHYRKSLDVARIYPSKSRESMKRTSTLSEEGDGGDSKFSFAEFIQTRQSVTSEPLPSETQTEHSVPEVSLPKQKISPKRNSRASSEQPSTAYSHVDDDQQTSRRHYRKSLDVARIYPSRRRESMKRTRTLSEDGDGGDSKFSFAEFIQTRQSITSKPLPSETETEQTDHKNTLRERRSSSSHKDSSEKLQENLKHSLDSEQVKDTRSKDSKKSSIQEEEEPTAVVVAQETKKPKRQSRKSSFIPPVQLAAITEEQTPTSADVRAKSRRQRSCEPLAKKWKPARLNFDSNEDEEDTESSPAKRRTEKARSLPPCLSPKRNSIRQSLLPSVSEEDESQPLPKTSRSKKSSSSKAGSPSEAKRKSTNVETIADDMFQQPVAPSSQHLPNDMKIKGKPSSLPDLSRKQRKSSVRRSVLPKLPEEQCDEDESNRISLVGSSRQSSSGTHSKTSVDRQPRDSIKMAKNAAAWAEKVFGQTQAKWWAKIKEQQQKSILSVDGSTENLSQTSSPASKTRSKRNASPASSISPELPSVKTSARSRKDTDTESVKSDRSGRSTRAKKDDVQQPVKSDKTAKNSRSRKDVETASVKSDRSTRSTRKESETTPTESEKAVRSRRKNEVEILLSAADLGDPRTPNRRRRESSTSSGQSQKKRARTKKESSVSPGTSLQSDSNPATSPPTEPPQPDKNADMSLLVEEYAENRRLTRHQKSLLERSLTSDVHLPLKKEEAGEKDVASSDSDEDYLFTPVKSRTRSKH
ncbi:hypothetical protein O3M35_001523 [Rhynocoris fuscipes]|uniref:Protein ELYS n=1 Tax=Rhynocoris fuscipes TaxID=488301 RepID=A0AAW1CNS4_9HEMI